MRLFPRTVRRYFAEVEWPYNDGGQRVKSGVNTALNAQQLACRASLRRNQKTFSFDTASLVHF
jgi:hypothetical protein